MGLWSALVLIAAIWGFVMVVRARSNSAAGYASDGQGGPVGDPAREAELRREIEDLRERIKVLERIATEGGDARRLAAEIERLRDEDQRP